MRQETSYGQSLLRRPYDVTRSTNRTPQEIAAARRKLLALFLQEWRGTSVKKSRRPRGTCDERSCSKRATCRISLNIWGTLVEADVCHEHSVFQ